MAPTLPRPPTCERRSTLSNAEIYLSHSAATPAYIFDDYSNEHALGLDLGSSMTAQYPPETSKHAPLPCCTQPFCDFDMYPAVDPALSNVCMDPGACFDFACLDESCLQYATTPCEEPGCTEECVTTPCEEPGCMDTAALGCGDPNCEETVNCLDCLDNPALQACTTCCLSDVCPNSAHTHLPSHAHPIPAGYVPWYPQQQQQHHHYGNHFHPSTCSSNRSSVEPRLSAALQNASLSYTSSPIISDTRSTPATIESIALGTPSRGGHRRLQGSTARQPNGTYACHWTLEQVTGMTCGLLFADAKGLHEHIQSDHFAGSASNHPCSWYGCDSGTFSTRPKLARHLHSHTEYKPHNCNFPGCSLSFVTQQQRDVHRKKHTGEKPFACKVCGKAFAYMDLLKSHMRSGVHGQADKKFACVICGEGFSDSSNRTKHTKNVHDPITGVPCPEPGCSYVDTRREKLKSHCESTGHALHLVSNTHEWEAFFTREQCQRSHKGHKKKRSAHQAGFEAERMPYH